MPIDGIKVEGLRELRTRARKANADAAKEMRAAAKEAAQDVANTARPIAPRKSGRLAKSIKVSASQDSASVKAGSPGRVPYAGPIHWGWPKHNIKGRAFLKVALGRRKRDVRRRFQERIDRIAAKLPAR